MWARASSRVRPPRNSTALDAPETIVLMSQEILSIAIFQPLEGQEQASLDTMRALIAALSAGGYSRDLFYRDAKSRTEYILLRYWKSEVGSPRRPRRSRSIALLGQTRPGNSHGKDLRNFGRSVSPVRDGIVIPFRSSHSVSVSPSRCAPMTSPSSEPFVDTSLDPPRPRIHSSSRRASQRRPWCSLMAPDRIHGHHCW